MVIPNYNSIQAGKFPVKPAKKSARDAVHVRRGCIRRGSSARAAIKPASTTGPGGRVRRGGFYIRPNRVRCGPGPVVARAGQGRICNAPLRWMRSAMVHPTRRHGVHSGTGQSPPAAQQGNCTGGRAGSYSGWGYAWDWSWRISMVASWARDAPVLGLREPLMPLIRPVDTAQTRAVSAQSETEPASG